MIIQNSKKYYVHCVEYLTDELEGGEEVEQGREEMEQEPEGRHGGGGHQPDQHRDRH